MALQRINRVMLRDLRSWRGEHEFTFDEDVTVLHGPRAPELERELGALARAAGAEHVSLSHEVDARLRRDGTRTSSSAELDAWPRSARGLHGVRSRSYLVCHCAVTGLVGVDAAEAQTSSGDDACKRCIRADGAAEIRRWQRGERKHVRLECS